MTERSSGNTDTVIKAVGQGSVPLEFITIGTTFETALGRCVIRDDAQKSAIIILKSRYEMFGMTEAIKDLTNLLNASCTVGGFNRSLAAMTYDRIFVSEGAGIKMSKESQRAANDIQKQQRMNKNRNGESDGEDRSNGN
jgi:hypothetical protein